MMAEPIEFAKYVPEYLVPLVPALTRDGFKKVDIPSELYSSIINTRNKSLVKGNIFYEKMDIGIQNGPVVI